MENQNNQVSLESIENLSYSNFNNVYKELSKHNYKEGYQKRLLAQAIKKTAHNQWFFSTFKPTNVKISDCVGTH